MSKFNIGLVAAVSVMTLTGCSNFVQEVERGTIMNLPGSYHIIQHKPGTDKADHYWLRSVKVTQETGTDGVFFIKDGNLLELTGTLTVVRLNKDFNGPEVMPEGLLDK